MRQKNMQQEDITCSLNDKIQCICGKISAINEVEMIFEKSHRLPNPEGGCWQTGYYYCSCDTKKPRVYTSGDDTYVLSNPELAELVE